MALAKTSLYIFYPQQDSDIVYSVQKYLWPGSISTRILFALAIHLSTQDKATVFVATIMHRISGELYSNGIIYSRQWNEGDSGSLCDWWTDRVCKRRPAAMRATTTHQDNQDRNMSCISYGLIGLRRKPIVFWGPAALDPWTLGNRTFVSTGGAMRAVGRHSSSHLAPTSWLKRR